MRATPVRATALLLALLAGPLASRVTAQNEPAAVSNSEQSANNDGDAVAGDESFSGQASAEGATLPAAEVKPVVARPAEMAVKAASNSLVKVVNTGKRFVAVGARGHILLSADGKAWRQVPVPVDSLLTSVAFADNQHGWAVGHDAVILGTTDGGESWKLQHFQPDLAKPLFDLLFFDTQHGIAVGAYGLMLETRDAGSTWVPAADNVIAGEERHMNAVARLGDGSVMVIGETGLIGLSTDQGETWTKIASPYESSLFCVLPAGDKGAIIGGLRGNVFFSADVTSGNWSKIDTGTDQSLFGMAALPGNKVAMVGLNATLLVFKAGGGSKQVPITDKNGNKQTDTLSWLLPTRDGSVLLVGDAGVQRLDAAKF